MFQKYQIVIFKNSTGKSCGFQLSSLVVIIFLIFLIALITSSVFFAKEYQKLRVLRAKIAMNELTFEEQYAQLADISNKMVAAREDLNRVQIFNAKLRSMLSVDGELQQTSQPRGGDSDENFSIARLPMHRQYLMMRKLNSYINRLASETKYEELNQQELLISMRHNNDMVVSIPSIWPVDGILTSRFGRRPSPFSGQIKIHKGIDIAARTGAPVSATASGKVISAGYLGSYGNCILIDHGDGLSTRYAHLKTILISNGQKVLKGEQIGLVGSTGHSSGPHLHYEVLINNVPVDPMRYILN